MSNGCMKMGHLGSEVELDNYVYYFPYDLEESASILSSDIVTAQDWALLNTGRFAEYTKSVTYIGWLFVLFFWLFLEESALGLVNIRKGVTSD